jgi:isocitrate lyase
MTKQQALEDIQREWRSARWAGVERHYTAEDVYRIRGSVRVEYSLARYGADRLWELLQGEEHVAALGALTGNQAVQRLRRV